MKTINLILLSASALSLTACASTIDKLSRVGQQPPMTEVSNPQSAPGYKPMSWPLPDPQNGSDRSANSLWQPGARGFFRDQRATRVGDILRVNVAIADQAQLANNTNAQRQTSDNSTMSAALGGLGKKVASVVGANPANLVDTSGNTNTVSTGKVDRKETIDTQVAALVTQVLPNGNLVIEGTQEILVNYEIREVSVKGVIRPEDINSDDTVESNQIAQARIVYSGRGQISDIEQARWGQQVIEAISPF